MYSTPKSPSHLRLVLSLALSWLLLLVPLSSSARPISSIDTGFQGKNTKLNQDVDSFIIESVDGVSTCREASKEEVPLTLHRPDDLGVPVENLVADSQTPSAPGSGLTINLVALSQLQADPNMATVVAAFQKAAAVWTARIKNPVTVSINIDYGPNLPGGGPFGSGVLGSTSSLRTSVDYPGVRTNLLASASGPAETTIYNRLPTSFVPTDTGNGAVVSASRSVSFALGLTNVANQNIATIAFNSNFAFDFNPDDGISGGTDFVAVAAHEIGHALGFSSSAGQGATSSVSLWDLYRFRPGTTTGTFTTATRIMSIGGGAQVYFTGETFNVAGSPTTELGLSTGGPDAVTTNGGDGRQSSHWKADELSGQYIGIMDPTISANVHQVATENDFMTLETLGWNLISSVAPPPLPPPPPPPANDNFGSAVTLNGCSGSVGGVNVGATHETGEPNHSPDNGGGNRSVWYQWQSPASGSATITTIGSSFDTVLGVYTGSSVGSLTTIAKDDDSGSSTEHTSSVTFTATAGTIYRIAVDGYDNGGSGGDFGTFTLNWGGALCASASVQLASATSNPAESIGSVAVAVTRTGDSSGTSTVDYATSDTAGNNGCNVNTGAASSRCDYIETRGTVTFSAGQTSKDILIPIVNDSYAEGSETFLLTLSNVTGATLGQSTTTITIVDNDGSTGVNPIDTAGVFVRQHYIDFLNREPDSSGFNFWTGEIASCGANAQCVEIKRINVSAAFFLSIEFQQTGYLVYRFYKSAFGNLPGAPVPVVLSDFLRDTQRIGQGVQVNVGNWQQQLEANKQAYALAFVQRSDFLLPSNYPTSMTATAFVTQLNSRAGDVLSAAEQTTLINALSANPSDPTLRSQTLRAVAENDSLHAKEFNHAFVLMQYFGYMRRNPNGFPDSNFDGYNFWLGKLNQFNGDFIQAEMVKAFISSDEYRHRFGP